MCVVYTSVMSIEITIDGVINACVWLLIKAGAKVGLYSTASAV